METNEQDNVVESQNNEEATAEETEATEEETRVEKPKRTPQEELEYLEGRAKRLRKKLGVDVDPEKPEKSESTQKSGELDWGERAFLKSYDIKGADELALVKQWRARTGDELDTLVEDDIFQSKLKSLRDVRSSKEAIPSGSKRATTAAKDSMEYALNKYEQSGELPSDPKLRIAVLNAKVSKSKDPFMN